MNKALLFNIFKAILFIATRSLRMVLLVGLSLLCNESLFNNIKKREKWNREYDEHAAEVTRKEDY